MAMQRLNVSPEEGRYLRVFADDAGKVDLALTDVGGEALVVSHHALRRSAQGPPSSWTDAADPRVAAELVESLASALERDGLRSRGGCSAPTCRSSC